MKNVKRQPLYFLMFSILILNLRGIILACLYLSLFFLDPKFKVKSMHSCNATILIKNLNCEFLNTVTLGTICSDIFENIREK